MDDTQQTDAQAQAQTDAQPEAQAQGFGNQFADSLANRGGTVHPFGVDLPTGGVVHFSGLTVRDYYAAHAPNEIPHWFTLADPLPLVPVPHVPGLLGALKTAPGWEEADQQLQDAALAALHNLFDGFDNAGNSPADQLAAFAFDVIQATTHASDIAQEQNATIERQNLARRYFAWRRFYGDQMVVALNG